MGAFIPAKGHASGNRVFMTEKITFLKHLLLVIAIVAITASCNKQDDDSLVPSYLFIEKIDLQTGYEQGTASHKITDAWIYVNESLIGAFELPATVPILDEGDTKITIRPGIKLNGISNTRAIYPFFNPVTRQLKLVRDSVIEVKNVVTTYRSNVKFPWLESFEAGVMSLDTTRKSSVKLQRTGDPELCFTYPGEAGEFSALVRLNSDTAIFEAVGKESYDFPAAGSEVFLEMNYKTENSLVVGVIYLATGIRVQRPLLILNKSNEWNKVYVNLTVPKYDTPNATDFRIFFGAQTDAGLQKADILIDNLKLIHF